MDLLLSRHSQEDAEPSNLPASNMLAVEPAKVLLSSSPTVEPQAVSMPLTIALLTTDSARNMTMVVDLTPTALTPVTRGPY